MQKFDDTLTKMTLKLVRDIHADMKLKDNFTIKEFLFVVQFHASQSPGGVLGVVFIAGVLSVGLITLAIKVFG